MFKGEFANDIESFVEETAAFNVFIGEFDKFVFESVELMGGKTENSNGSGFRKFNETFVRFVGNLSKFVFESIELIGGKTESGSSISGRDHDGE